MRTRNSQSHKRFVAWGPLILLAGLVCLPDATTRADFAIRTVGLQAPSRPGTLLHGEIKLINVLFDKPQDVQLKIVEFIPTADHQWRPVDPNGPMDPNNLINIPKSQSCRKWISLPLTKITIKPVDVVVVPVDIRIPKDLAGLYRAAIVVSVPPSESQDPIITGYDLVVPVLLEVKEPLKGSPIDYEPEEHAIEIHPDSRWSFPQDKHPDPRGIVQEYVSKTPFSTTFPVQLEVSASANSPAGGIWRASIDRNESYDTSQIEISVTGKDIRIDNLTRTSRPKGGPKWALVTVQVLPDLSDWPFFWHNEE